MKEIIHQIILAGAFLIIVPGFLIAGILTIRDIICDDDDPRGR
jgi:hypothetical protein